MNMDTHMSGSTVKNHISLKTVFEYSVIRKTSYQSWFLVYQRVLPQACLLQHSWHLQGRKLIIPSLPQACLPQHPRHLQRKLIIQIILQQSCQVKELFWNIRRVVTWTNQNPIIMKKESRAGTGRPVFFRHTRMVARIQRKSCGGKSSWTQRLTRQFFSWTIYRAHIQEKCGFG